MKYEISSLEIDDKISITYDPDSELWFEVWEGHCNSCTEQGSTPRITMKELAHFLINKDEFLAEKAKEKIKQRNNMIIVKQKAIEELISEKAVLERELDKIKDTIKIIGKKKSK